MEMINKSRHVDSKKVEDFFNNPDGHVLLEGFMQSVQNITSKCEQDLLSLINTYPDIVAATGFTYVSGLQFVNLEKDKGNFVVIGIDPANTIMSLMEKFLDSVKGMKDEANIAG